MCRLKLDRGLAGPLGVEVALGRKPPSGTNSRAGEHAVTTTSTCCLFLAFVSTCIRASRNLSCSYLCNSVLTSDTTQGNQRRIDWTRCGIPTSRGLVGAFETGLMRLSTPNKRPLARPPLGADLFETCCWPPKTAAARSLSPAATDNCFGVRSKQ